MYMVIMVLPSDSITIPD